MRKKNILVIGLGRFGSHLATMLQEKGNKVMIVDVSQESIDKLADRFENALVADGTNKDALLSLGIKSFDVIFVSIAKNFEASCVITALLKELGAKKVVSKATNDVQVSILKKIGADEVIDPDFEIADKIAGKYAGSELFDYIELSGSEYDIFEIKTPLCWAEKTIIELNLRATYGINIIGIRDAKTSDLLVNPSPQTILKANNHLSVIATKQQVEKVMKLK